MKNNVIFYKGKTQFENMGDLLINRTLLDILSSYGEIIIDDRVIPSAYFEKLTKNISNIKKINDLTSKSYNYFFYKTLLINFFTKSSMVYFLDNPGHNLSNVEIPSRVEFNELKKKRLFTYLGCKFLKLGVTIGPYSQKMFVHQAKVSKFYRKILVRDVKSLVSLKKFGYKNFGYMPDLAWAYNSSKLNDNTTTAPIGKEVRVGGKYIVLSFRDSIEGIERNPEYFSKLLVAIEKVLELYKESTFVLTYQVQYDRAVCEDIFNKFSSKYKLNFQDEILSIEGAFRIYSNSEFVLSNRLHVLMLAIKSDTLPMALSDIVNHFKVVSMFEDEGMKKCLLDINDFNSGNLETRLSEKNKIIEEFKEIRVKNAQLILDEINEVFELK